jgi:hypothetical protein
MSTKELKRQSAREAFKAEVFALKGKLPENWKERLRIKHPEYDTAKGTRLLDNIITGRSTDAIVLGFMKEIIQEFELEQKQPNNQP